MSPFIFYQTSCHISGLPFIYGILNYVFLVYFKDNQSQDRSGLRLNWQSYMGKLNVYFYYLQFCFSLVSLWNILVDKACWMLWWEWNQKITSLLMEGLAKYTTLNNVAKFLQSYWACFVNKLLNCISDFPFVKWR